jgi:hypothetical protein
MMFTVAAGYAVAVWLIIVALNGLYSIGRVPVVARASARRMPQREPLHLTGSFGKNGIR